MITSSIKSSYFNVEGSDFWTVSPPNEKHFEHTKKSPLRRFFIYLDYCFLNIAAIIYPIPKKAIATYHAISTVIIIGINISTKNAATTIVILYTPTFHTAQFL